jgi:hypothetical protein
MAHRTRRFGRQAGPVSGVLLPHWPVGWDGAFDPLRKPPVRCGIGASIVFESTAGPLPINTAMEEAPGSGAVPRPSRRPSQGTSYRMLVVAGGDLLNEINNAAAEFWILDAHEVFRE